MNNASVVIIIVFAMLPILLTVMTTYIKLEKLEDAIKEILIQKDDKVEKTRWIPMKTVLGDYVQEYHCSKCRFRITTGEYDSNRFKFCPKCGKEIENDKSS